VIGKTNERIRGSALQKRRRKLFEKEPLCVLCLVKTPPVTRVATQRDHLVPLHKGGVDDESNEQSLCDDCHMKKTKEERGHTFKPKRRIGLDGFPVDDPGRA
jgi:5-methylcytosine-specific restriction protein A